MVGLPRKQPLPLLRLLLNGYVYNRTDEAVRLTILAVPALATRLDPAGISVLSQQPIFLIVLFSGGDGVIDSVSDPLCVLGMDARKVLRQRCARVSFRRIDREHFCKASIGKEGVGLHVPVECAHHSRSVQGLTQPLLGLR